MRVFVQLQTCHATPVIEQKPPPPTHSHKHTHAHTPAQLACLLPPPAQASGSLESMPRMMHLIALLPLMHAEDLAVQQVRPPLAYTTRAQWGLLSRALCLCRKKKEKIPNWCGNHARNACLNPTPFPTRPSAHARPFCPTAAQRCVSLHQALLLELQQHLPEAEGLAEWVSTAVKFAQVMSYSWRCALRLCTFSWHSFCFCSTKPCCCCCCRTTPTSSSALGASRTATLPWVSQPLVEGQRSLCVHWQRLDLCVSLGAQAYPQLPAAANLLPCSFHPAAAAVVGGDCWVGAR